MKRLESFLNPWIKMGVILGMVQIIGTECCETLLETRVRIT
jgi:hypothetical protein